jgi:transcriptional regulator with XRE-family HTH domain
MNDPDLQRWLLAPDGIATRLRTLRGTTLGKTFAATAGMAASRLSKLELAQQTPTAADIRAIVTAAGQPTELADELIAKLGTAPAVKTSARVNRFGQVATQKRLTQLLAQAATVRLFDNTYMPRLAQTLEYATAVLEAAAQTRGIRSEAKEAAAVYTSAAYLHVDHHNYQFVITEPVLRWQILPPAQMKAQLEWLLLAAARPNVDLRIITLDRPTVVLPPASFGLVDDRGFTDTLDGADELTGARLAGHVALMDELAAAAVRGPEALALVRSALAGMQNVAPVRFDAGPHA